MGSLAEYNRKRNFELTSEPPGKAGRTKSGQSFVIQKHAASHLHYDFRLEIDGVLKSWSVPKGPSFDPSVKRLAMATEDHPIEYGGFEGVIPAGQYGGGTVMLWDRGEWEPLGTSNPAADLHAGSLKFRLKGEKLQGMWALVRIKGGGRRPYGRGQDNRGDPDGRTWLLIKERDDRARPEAEWSVTEAQPKSVATGRDLPEIKGDADRVWHSNRNRPDPSSLKGARPAPMPEDIAVAVPTVADKAASGRDWVHEVEVIGERVLCRIENGSGRMLAATRGMTATARRKSRGETSGAAVLKDRSRALSDLVKAALRIPCQQAIFDGVATKLGADGETRGGPGADTLYLFDVLYLDGHDLRGVPLGERKQLLGALIAASAPAESATKTRGRGSVRGAHVRYVDHVQVRGTDAFREGCRLGAPGLVSKPVGSLYSAGAECGWVVVRCPREPKAKAEVKAKAKAKAKVKSQRQPPPQRNQGRSTTKQPRVAVDSASPGVVAGIRLTHPERVVFPDAGLTKLDLARYYEQIAAFALPHLEDRPLMIKRCPDGAAGACFFVKHPGQSAPKEVRHVPIAERKTSGNYMVVDDVASLVAMAQMNALEIHTWNSRAADLERPDRVVFDLDPGEEVPWEKVIAAAQRIRAALEAVDLESFVKTTGSKGLHVVVPLAPSLGWDDTFAFSRAVSERLAAESPSEYTTAIPKSGRRAKILIDFLRNNRGATSVSAYSTRARPSAPVSVPLDWRELGPRIRSDAFTVPDVLTRLSRGRDPWREYGRVRQKLTPAVLKAVRAGN